VLTAELTDLRAMRIPAFAETAAYSRLLTAYNKVSDVLGRALNFDDRIWEDARPDEVVPSEQMITDALADVLATSVRDDMASAMRLQRALLAGCPAPVQEYYRERPLSLVPMPRGRLAPDLLLDGRSYHPESPVPHVFVIEVKYLADWQVPYARRLFGDPASDGHDPVTIWGIGHDDPSGQRVPHAHGARADCDGFWHHLVGGGLYVASAVQLDIYVAYTAQVLRGLGVAEDHSAPLRVRGVLVDAWARKVDADLAVTWRQWTTVSFADLLAEAYGALCACDPGSAAAGPLKVLLARLLWL
jgi:hypothetical protein